MVKICRSKTGEPRNSDEIVNCISDTIKHNRKTRKSEVDDSILAWHEALNAECAKRGEILNVLALTQLREGKSRSRKYRVLTLFDSAHLTWCH